MNSRERIDHASEHLDRAADHSGEAAHHAKEAMEAGASGVLERGAETLRRAERHVENAVERTAETARNVGHVAERAIHTAPDTGLERKAGNTVERVVHGAGNALQSAAPAVGRGAEIALSATGTALTAASKVLGVVVGKIAGRVGGWWNGASEAIAELPDEERQACMVHFESYPARPSGMTFDHALPGYSIGYVAARNPDYRGRRFEEIEGDLRHGFGDDFDSLREFSRFGYERGITGL